MCLQQMYAQIEFQVGYELYKPTDNENNTKSIAEIKSAGAIWNLRDQLFGDTLGFPINSSFGYGSNDANAALFVELSHTWDRLKLDVSFRKKGRYNAQGFAIGSALMYQLPLFDDLFYDEFQILLSGGVGLSYDRSFQKNLWDIGLEKHYRDQFLERGFSDNYYEAGESPADQYIQTIKDSMNSERLTSAFGAQAKISLEGSYYLFDTGLFARLRAQYEYDASRFTATSMDGFSIIVAVGYIFPG